MEGSVGVVWTQALCTSGWLETHISGSPEECMSHMSLSNNSP